VFRGLLLSASVDALLRAPAVWAEDGFVDDDGAIGTDGAVADGAAIFRVIGVRLTAETAPFPSAQPPRFRVHLRSFSHRLFLQRRNAVV
jgi:hypothetical protein